MPNLIRKLLLCAFALGWMATFLSADAGSPVGTWYLNANQERITIKISRAPRARGFFGVVIRDDGGTETLDEIAWDAKSRRLEFRRKTTASWQWYRGSVMEGVFVGRFAQRSDSDARPKRPEEFQFHVTGWNSAYFDRAIVPRVYELLCDGENRARLRIDSAGARPGFIGRFKIYSTVGGRAAGEELEHDVDIQNWDGSNLSFLLRRPDATQSFSGRVDGRLISVTYTGGGKAESVRCSGVRAEVLSYGLSAKTREARSIWQKQTRRQFWHLMIAGNPTPKLRKETTLRKDLPPTVSLKLPSERDDDPAAWPQNYKLSELQFDFTLPNPYGGSPMERRARAYLAMPSSPHPIGGKYPAILALNGHGGSAWKLFQPDDALYWYGDAFARRGFIVLALDVSHRPAEDRRAPSAAEPLYSGSDAGDDPVHGNGLHPAIKNEEFDSDWEEDGERVWDAMRAIDYLLSLPQVDASRVAVTGLSMGGTIATMVAALDTRITLALPAAPSADLGVMLYKGNHSCWRWLHGDEREYFDSSDLNALIAPRPLVILNGKSDSTYSRFQPPFASSKQVLRRSQAAYGQDAANLVHYLHYDGHRFHAGDKNPTQPRETGVQTPLMAEPAKSGTLEWQTDARTERRWANLFDCLNELWRKR